MDRANSVNYRPWLDGVRAVAIGLVILAHAGLLRDLPLGNAGVGIFFALSGYLITGLLLDELERAGDIRLRRFYLRRFARLMPALVVAVTICSCLFVATGTYDELKSALFALTYTTNYGTIYLGRHMPGFGYTWSLAVEEHFYLAWPVLLLFLWRRQPLERVLKVTLMICLGALLWRTLLSFFVSDLRILYVGSLERADALLFGCAGAMAMRLKWRPHRALFPLGLVLIATFILFDVPWHALEYTLLAVGSTCVLVTLDTYPSVWRRLLSLKPAVFIGVMSYGIYLWHGPLFTVAARVGFSSLPAKLALTALSVAIAYCSYRLIETPIRSFARSKERAPSNSAGGLVGTALTDVAAIKHRE